MTSVIADNRPFEFVSIKHLGCIKNGVEDTDSEEIHSWAPSLENYTFADAGESTELKIIVDAIPGIEKYMAETWPKALARLKAQCERRSPDKLR